MPSTAINPFMNPFNASCAFLFLFAYNIIGGWRFDVLCNTTEVMTFDVTCNHCVRSVNDNNNRVKIQILKAFSPYIYIVRTCSSDVVVILSWVVQLSSLMSWPTSTQDLYQFKSQSAIHLDIQIHSYAVITLLYKFEILVITSGNNSLNRSVLFFMECISTQFLL